MSNNNKDLKEVILLQIRSIGIIIDIFKLHYSYCQTKITA